MGDRASAAGAQGAILGAASGNDVGTNTSVDVADVLESAGGATKDTVLAPGARF